MKISGLYILLFSGLLQCSVQQPGFPGANISNDLVRRTCMLPCNQLLPCGLFKGRDCQEHPEEKIINNSDFHG